MFKPFAPHMVDGYKLGHAGMYAEGTDFLCSNLTPRSNKYFKGSRLYDGKMVVFGAFGAIQEIVQLWDETFFQKEKSDALRKYRRRVEGYLGKDVIDFKRMSDLHDLGYLPLEIKTIDEGSRIAMKIPMLTIKNTHPDFFWLVNYLETILSAMIWKGTTNATIAYEYKRIATDYAIKTGCPVESVLFQIHGFEMRGMSGVEDASRSGAGPLATGLLGTDTVGAIDYIEDYYGHGLNLDNYLIAASVPATEHAVSSSNILSRAARMESGSDIGDYVDTRLLAEAEFLLDYITKVIPTGIASYVADTYDYWNVLSKVLAMPYIKKAILERDGKLVIRPDSGDPADVICGVELPSFANDKYLHDNLIEHGYKIVNNGNYDTSCAEDEVSFFYRVDGVVHKCIGLVDVEYDRSLHFDQTTTFECDLTPQEKGSIEVLWEIFGGTVNEAGFKVLDSHIGLIYGDSITIDRADKIFKRLMDKGFASCNVVLGVGSYTYQMNSRDTLGTAMKATVTGINGELLDIYKDPATGDKLKKSAKGFLYVFRDTNGEFQLVDQVDQDTEKLGELKVRFKDGKFFNHENIKLVRDRLAF